MPGGGSSLRRCLWPGTTHRGSVVAQLPRRESDQ